MGGRIYLPMIKEFLPVLLLPDGCQLSNGIQQVITMGATGNDNFGFHLLPV